MTKENTSLNQADDEKSEPFEFAHFSDIHLLETPEVKGMNIKQKLGLLKWRQRAEAHDFDRIEHAMNTLEELGIRHVCLTGDLVHLGTEPEIEAVAQWLNRFRGRGFVFHLVPGNHDAMSAQAKGHALRAWCDQAQTGDNSQGGLRFPYCHDADSVSFIGLDSASVTPPGMACGHLDTGAINHCEQLLAKTAEAGRFRIVLLHHPLTQGIESPRRLLYGARRLRRALQRVGAELVLHGHVHRQVRASLKGREGPIPVFGATSLSAKGNPPNGSARFTVFRCPKIAEHGAIQYRDYHWDASARAMRPSHPFTPINCEEPKPCESDAK